MTSEQTTIDVDFESEWTEGTVSTAAKLNLQTGEVVAIVASDDAEDEDLGDLLGEQIVVKAIVAAVESNAQGRYFVCNAPLLQRIRDSVIPA